MRFAPSFVALDCRPMIWMCGFQMTGCMRCTASVDSAGETRIPR